jgi:hypothetical protein
MDRTLFNDEQNAHMDALAAMPPETRCWCGWDEKGKCYNCTRDPRVSDKTCADKLTLRCEECGNTPSLPTWPVFHGRYCSKAQPISEKNPT